MNRNDQPRNVFAEKTFVDNISANGAHFRLNDKMTNADIAAQNTELLNSVINNHIPKKYYVDTRAFLNLNDNIDYRKIFTEE